MNTAPELIDDHPIKENDMTDTVDDFEKWNRIITRALVYLALTLGIMMIISQIYIRLH